MSKQLDLNFESAETGSTLSGVGVPDEPLSSPRSRALPVSKVKGQNVATATVEKVIERLTNAFTAVAANKGAPGPDGRSVAWVREHLAELLPVLSDALLTGTYLPGDIRRVWIPKAGGGQRGLGIPNVLDRLVQEAVRQVLEPHFEPSFHPNSRGFRPGRSCHTAIRQAVEYLEAGRARVVLPDGVVVSNDEGVPQGGPLSPLLSNIVLDELDWHLHARGHCFVR